MIDYEYKIRVIEQDLEHYRMLQQIQRDHLDAHDRSIDAIQETLKDVGAKLSALAGQMNQLTANVDRLVAALLRDHPNGGAK